MKLVMKALAVLAALAGLALSSPIKAQDAIIVATCGTFSYQPGATLGRLTVDTTGKLCDSSSGGGGGSVTQGTSPWIVAGAAGAALMLDATGQSLLSAVQGPIPAGAAVIGYVGGDGTAGTASTHVVSVQGIASMTPLLVTPTANSAVNVAQINGVTPLMGSGNTGTGSPRVTISTDQLALAAWGFGATGATVPAGAGLTGCRAASAAPTEVTDGQMVAAQCGLGGKLINIPYTVKELAVRGTITGTDTAAHTIIAAGSGSNKTYVTSIQCSNSSATATSVTFSDSVSTPLYLPATGGNNATFPVPLVTAAATAFTFTASVGVTTVTCNAQGYSAL